MSANPSVVSTNTASTNNRTEIRALFVGPNNAAIPAVRVRFDLNGDPNSIGGTFSTGCSVIYSDANGIATTAYIPGAKSSPTNGVTIRACYDINDFAAGPARTRRSTTITVASDPLSVSIGSNADILIGPNNLTYSAAFVILVVDASGSAKANVAIVPSIDLDRYWKGFYTSRLPPGSRTKTRRAALTRTSTATASRDGRGHQPQRLDRAAQVGCRGVHRWAGKTDASGTASCRSSTRRTSRPGCASRSSIAATGRERHGRPRHLDRSFAGAGGAMTSTSSPPFVVSPYGAVYAADDPTTHGFTTFPDGTPIAPGVIVDPCKNPF